MIDRTPSRPPTMDPQAAEGRLYRAIFETNSAVKLLIDPEDGRIVDANPAAAAFYGWPREVLRTMSIFEINMLSPEEVAAELEDARAGKRGYFRFRHRIASGDVRHVEIHSGAVEVEGRVLLLSILHDVSERVALEEQLAQARELEATGRVAGGVAHDFNNLLTVIGTACEALAASMSPTAADRESLADIRHATLRASGLTRQLLAFSRRQELAARPVQLNDIVAGALGFLQRAVGGGVRLHTSLAPDLPCISADVGQLEQVILNLALNARDAMEGHGTLHFGTSLDGDRVVLTVTDEGRGMDEATRARIFEPFFTTKPRGQGTGLGLATAYGIVKQSGGTIAAESCPGVGTTFTVHLPAHPGDLPEAAADRATILVVDDDPSLRRAATEQLQHAGYRVVAAGSAEEALALPVEALARVGALVTDLEMPGSSGIELADRLRATRPGLPVLVMSGRTNPVLPEGVGFLQKPFTLSNFLRQLRERVGHAAE